MSKRRANGEGSIRKRKDGRWEVRVSIGIDFATGKSKRISKYASTQEEAVKILHDLTYVNSTAPKSFETIRLGDWLDICMKVYMKPSLKQSTYSCYEGYVHNHFKPALGGVYLRDITPRMLQQFYNYKSVAEGLSPKTIININLFLHKALSYALTEGYILSNPSASINLPRGPKPQIEILTRNEQERLIAESYQHRYGVFIRLVLFTGLRLGELLGLKWEDIDFSGGLLYVRRSLNRVKKDKEVRKNGCATEVVTQSPKTQNSIRSIPLLRGILDELNEWKRVQAADALAAGEGYCNSGFVVTNLKGGCIEPRMFRDYYNRILNAAHLQHFTFHALRHTFASRALEQGMDAKTLSVILGHYSVSFTLDTYAHVLNDHKREEMALMEELFYGDTQHEKQVKNMGMRTSRKVIPIPVS